MGRPAATGPGDAAILAHLSVLAAQLRPQAGDGRHVLVICQPKSASTFLCNILGEILGRPVVGYADRTVHGYSFSLHAARRHAESDVVVHLHALPGAPLVAWCLAKQIRPVILTRNVPDALVSMYEHKLRAAESLDRSLFNAPREQGLTAVTFEWAHWYLRFETMWASLDEVVRPVRTTYERLTADPEGEVLGLCRALGIEADAVRVGAAVAAVAGDTRRSNRNVGIAGRGHELPASLRRAIADLRPLL